MKETILAKFAVLSFFEVLILLGAIVFCIFCLVLCIVLLINGIAVAFDRLNIKSFSFRNGFTFYKEGEERKPRASKTKANSRREAK